MVGERGWDKGGTGRSILRIVEGPGRVVSGEILLREEGRETDRARLDAESREMRQVRGGDIALIFQEPMTSFSPVHTVGSQMIETIRLHQALDKKAARDNTIQMFRLSGIPRPQRPPHAYPLPLTA